MSEISKKQRHLNFIDDIYRLGLLDMIDINTWERKTITMTDGIWEWNATKNIWPNDVDELVELRISCCNEDWVRKQKFPISVHNKIFCQRSCFVYTHESPFNKPNTICRDNLVFQDIKMKY
jgi:hypothetical protein